MAKHAQSRVFSIDPCPPQNDGGRKKRTASSCKLDASPTHERKLPRTHRPSSLVDPLGQPIRTVAVRWYINGKKMRWRAHVGAVLRSDTSGEVLYQMRYEEKWPMFPAEDVVVSFNPKEFKLFDHSSSELLQWEHDRSKSAAIRPHSPRSLRPVQMEAAGACLSAHRSKPGIAGRLQDSKECALLAEEKDGLKPAAAMTEGATACRPRRSRNPPERFCQSRVDPAADKGCDENCVPAEMPREKIVVGSFTARPSASQLRVRSLALDERALRSVACVMLDLVLSVRPWA